MAEGQEYAQILPRSNAAGLFAQNFLRSRQTAEQRDILRAQQEAKAAADKKKQDEADLNAILNDVAEVKKNYKDVPELGREGVNMVVAEMNKEVVSELYKGNLNRLYFHEVIQKHANKADAINQWSKAAMETEGNLTKAYTDIPGVNANGVNGLVRFITNKLGTKATPDVIQDFVNKNVGKVVDSNKGAMSYWATLGTYTTGIGSGANGRMTAGKETKTIQLDSEIEGEGMGSNVVPKGEIINLNNLGFRDEGMDPNKKAPWDLTPGKQVDWNNNVKKNRVVPLEGLADKDGNLRLYDETFYKSMMQNKGAELWINKLFDAEVERYEKETGKAFPQQEQIVEMAKRAIAYKERALVVDGKYNAVAAQPIAPRITVVNNNGGGSKGSEAVTVKEIQAKIDRAVALSPNGFVSAVDLPGDEQDAVLEQARKAAKADDAKEMDANNIGVQKGANGKSEIIYTKADGVTKVRLKTMDRLNTDVPKQPGIKEKRKVIGGGGTPAAVPAQKNKTVVTPGNVR